LATRAHAQALGAYPDPFARDGREFGTTNEVAVRTLFDE
jgi:hypothetical protein